MNSLNSVKSIVPLPSTSAIAIQSYAIYYDDSSVISVPPEMFSFNLVIILLFLSLNFYFYFLFNDFFGFFSTTAEAVSASKSTSA
jgi:hypothetical protein